MSDLVIFLYGLFVTGLCMIFAVVSILEVRRLGEVAERGAETKATGKPEARKSERTT